MQNDCIFCKIINGELPSFKVYEDEKFLAFLDLFSIVPGHTLVIPKEHHHYVWDVPNIDEYFETARKLATHFKSLGYEFVDSLTSGRGVPHAHIHLIPHNGNNKNWKSALKVLNEFQRDNSNKLTPEEGNKTAEKFRLPN